MKISPLVAALCLALACGAAVDHALAQGSPPKMTRSIETVSAGIRGLEALQPEQVQYVVLGEMHGTREIPAFFGDMVARVARVRPVTASLELPASEGERIEHFLASKGSAADRAALLDSGYWRNPMKDGRSSLAMVDLLDALRRLRGSGLHLGLALCQPDAQASPELYEAAMAKCWQSAAAAAPGNLIAILVGNVHASRRPVLGYKPAGAWLPQDAALSFDVVVTGGQVWNCVKACGVHDLFAVGPIPERGFYQGETRQAYGGVFDGLFSTGAPFTPSPPAVQAQP